MKTNKFFATAFAVLALVGFAACEGEKNPVDEPKEVTNLTLDQTSLTLEIGATATLVATVEPADAEATVAWVSQNPEVATVENGVVTALSAGNTIIVATAGSKTASCLVVVSKKEEPGTDPGQKGQLKGSQFWPIAIDGTTADANASKLVADFRPDDVGKFLYIWENTYAANENPTGLNFHGNTEGFTALTVGSVGWSGCGYCLTESDGSKAWEAAEALRAAIVASPDDYFLHIAIKSTDNASHCFYVLGSEATKFVLGSKSVYDGPLYKDFTRNGEWAEFDIPMAQYASALATTTCAAGVNVFVALSEGTAGAQLNMDAVYFYKK